jgi:ABC-type antimicrobial peptide transport system permease subunit
MTGINAAYMVAQRAREIGVRLALGATRRSVVAMIFTRAALLVAIGIALGGVASWYLVGTVKSFLFEFGAADVTAFVAAAAALALAACSVCVATAWRAAMLDPIVALRSE